MAELNEDSLRELFARSAMFEKPAKGKNGEEELPVPIACPPEVPRSYLARRGIGWNLPVLNGITRAPTLRNDCSVLDLPGYDAATGLYLDFGEHDFPQIPSEPTREDAIEALRLLRGLLSEFAFADKKEAGSPSESVALSAFLTAIIRPALPTAPLHAVTATTIGSGKSYLVDLIATIATGGAVAPIAAGPDDTELEKRLASALMAGASFISVDNITREINGDLLNQMLTQEKVSPRRLGKSENVEIPCTAFTMANGNNLIVPADMARRTLLCSLDARVERPELRKFEQDPIRKVKADRGKFVAAGLTILRGFIVAGWPERPQPLGSYEAWSGLVRASLVWLEMPDPTLTMDRVREADPKRQQLLAVMEQWNAVIGDARVTSNEIIKHATKPGSDEFREGLLIVAGERGRIDSRRLGRWLGQHKGRIVVRQESDERDAKDKSTEFKFEPGTERKGLGTWILQGAREAPKEDIASELSDLVGAGQG